MPRRGRSNAAGAKYAANGMTLRRYSGVGDDVERRVARAASRALARRRTSRARSITSRYPASASSNVAGWSALTRVERPPASDGRRVDLRAAAARAAWWRASCSSPMARISSVVRPSKARRRDELRRSCSRPSAKSSPASRQSLVEPGRVVARARPWRRCRGRSRRAWARVSSPRRAAPASTMTSKNPGSDATASSSSSSQRRDRPVAQAVADLPASAAGAASRRAAIVVQALGQRREVAREQQEQRVADVLARGRRGAPRAGGPRASKTRRRAPQDRELPLERGSAPTAPPGRWPRGRRGTAARPRWPSSRRARATCRPAGGPGRGCRGTSRAPGRAPGARAKCVARRASRARGRRRSPGRGRRWPRSWSVTGLRRRGFRRGPTRGRCTSPRSSPAGDRDDAVDVIVARCRSG